MSSDVAHVESASLTDRALEKQALAGRPVSRWTLIAYGSLALPLSIAEIPIVLYLPAFYAKELGLSAGLVGMVFLAARLWDGLSDVLIGWQSDRSNSRYGRRKPWVVVGTPFLMLSLWNLCNPPVGTGLLYLGVWAALFYTAATVVKIPYISWGTELATDYTERSRVTAFREAFTMLGNLFFVTAPLVLLTDEAPLSDVLFLITIIVLLTAPVAAAFLFFWVKDPPYARRTETDLRKELAVLIKDPVLIRLAIIKLLIGIAEGVINSLAVFSFTVGLGLPNKLFIVVFTLYIATLCALPATMRLARSVEKHRLLAAGLMIKAAAVGTLLFIQPGDFISVILIWIIVGVAHPSTIVLPTSMLADTIDHGEVGNGERRSGAYVAVCNLVIKVGLALGVGLSFGLLDLVNYNPAAADYSAADAQHIRLLGFGVPCFLWLPAAFLLLRYPITKAVQQKLRETINTRNRMNY